MFGPAGRLAALVVVTSVLPAPALPQNRELHYVQSGGKPAAAAETLQSSIFDLRFRRGISQRVLYVSPAAPVAVIVMLPGGTGKIGLKANGEVTHGDNFLVRTRDIWARHGYAVIIPDTIDKSSLRGDRSSLPYAKIVVQLANFARSQASAPVFLLGTSQGSIAAIDGAAHAPPGLISGVILTESVSRIGGSGESVFSAAPEQVRVPALIVANRADQCNVAPPSDAPRIAAAMKNSPDVHVEYVDGGKDRSPRACGSLTPHGYYGIETEVIDVIAHWIDSHR
ncbi:alpha/beta hydrolase [Bradyrhizobium lablabi]|uniref:alpha/beta hydrolase n=1 Tax=Bradyrhizobium lablabi TaxID=722472 RepID=UPI001BA8D074|nr:alpha/beta hydrolase [Bradyrhizobium lablabi]MBR1122249.1 alpha/beta hydrolase [Bradyrhizobium lablabi]